MKKASENKITRSSIQRKKKHRYIYRGKYKINFTPREADCIYILKTVYPNKKIATKLGIQPRTVESHIYNLRQKLGGVYKSSIIEKILSLDKDFFKEKDDDDNGE